MTPQDLSYAIDAVERCLDFSQPADGQLSAFFRHSPKLGRRQRAFVAETAYGVLRRLRSLEYLATAGSGRKPTPRRLALAWLARFGGHNLRQLEPLVGKGDLTWLMDVKAADLSGLGEAQRLDLPDWLHARLAEQYGGALPGLMASLNVPAPLDLRVNPARIGREEALAALRADGIAAEATPWSPLGLRLQGKPALQRYPRYLDGSLEVQDEGSQILGQLLAPRRGEMVCDFCAGAGGKTLLLGALMRNTGRLYAFDVSDRRLARFKPRLARSGLSNVQAQVIAHERDVRVKRLADRLDRVLVDAPCSGLGTLRRNPDLKWRQTPESVMGLARQQLAILEAASRLVKAGGRLVYATCSLLTEENETVVADFLRAHTEFRLVPAGQVLASQRIALEMGDVLRLDPEQHGTDGFFAAVLDRGPA